ncbi:hypothetical protein PoB_003773400 [Plakobranchus ocellatus]|uniref:FLYWCH-type domain-containing protein n=1 Tax=Plakobranchus ocellatus TaxID=259542 RepID=A0AAV4AXY2_9GAST|nr:hypothetical protein PoB_003773400 [Plakobranchus ocellatus]
MRAPNGGVVSRCLCSEDYRAGSDPRFASLDWECKDQTFLYRARRDMKKTPKNSYCYTHLAATEYKFIGITAKRCTILTKICTNDLFYERLKRTATWRSKGESEITNNQSVNRRCHFINLGLSEP